MSYYKFGDMLFKTESDYVFDQINNVISIITNEPNLKFIQSTKFKKEFELKWKEYDFLKDKGFTTHNLMLHAEAYDREEFDGPYIYKWSMNAQIFLGIFNTFYPDINIEFVDIVIEI